METIKANLERKGYLVTVCQTKEECAAYLLDQLHHQTIGIGGSATVKELGIVTELRKDNLVYWHGDVEQVDALGDRYIREHAQYTNVYISSVNGMSKDGTIINIDGCGNRIASTAFGHDRVILIVGKNKIAEDFEKAMWRARNIAAVKNAVRLKRNTPCAVKGDRCYDCNSPERICRGFLIMERALTGTKTEVILVNEDLGY